MRWGSRRWPIISGTITSATPPTQGTTLPEFQLDITDDPRFASHEARLQNAAALSSVLTEAFRHHTQREWVALLKARQVPCRVEVAAS